MELKRKKFLKLPKYLCSVERKRRRLLDQKKVQCLFWGVCGGACLQTKLWIVQLINLEVSVHFTLCASLKNYFSI